MKNVILIGGGKNEGKDYLSDIIESKVSLNRMSFAAPLKEIASKALGIDLDTLDWYKNEELTLHVFDESIAEPLNNCRQVLQELATSMRALIGEDVFANIVLEKIKKSEEKTILLSDWRFENELEVLKSHPEINVIKVKIFDRDVGNSDSHESETIISKLENHWFDLVVDNTGRKPVTESDIEELIEALLLNFNWCK